MNEITTSIAEAIKRRTTSLTLGSYLFFWCTYHWEGLYVTFFVSQDLIYQRYRILKNEYVERYFFGLNGFDDINFYLGILVPALITAFFIWVLPRYVLIHAYREEQKHKVSRRIVKLEEEKRLQVDKEKLAVQQQKTLTEKIKVADKEKVAAKKDPKILWEREFTEFKNSKEYNMFADVLKCVYQYNGKTKVKDEFDRFNNEFELEPQSLKMADVRDLISITQSGDAIKLTPKGKFFASKYDKNF